jgi:hypothetical protein
MLEEIDCPKCGSAVAVPDRTVEPGTGRQFDIPECPDDLKAVRGKYGDLWTRTAPGNNTWTHNEFNERLSWRELLHRERQLTEERA